MKFGIVGLGWPGQQHVQAIHAHESEAILSAVCDLDESKVKAFEGKCDTFTDIDRFFAEADMDTVVLAVPHQLHETLAVRALNLGKHVLIEKPMARTSEECKNMIDAAEKNNKTLMVAQNWRYQPWCIAAKAIIESGELGNIQAVRTEWLLNFRDAFPKGNWIYNGELAGGGAITSLAIHNVDALRFIIGEVEEVYTNQLYTDDWSTNGAENWAMVQMKFENGALGHLFTGYTPFFPPDNGMLQVYGDKGTMFFGPHQGETGLWIRSAKRSVNPNAGYERVDEAKYAAGLVEHPQTNQLKHFIDSVNSQTRPESDGREIIKTIELVEMMYDSGNKGTPLKK
ncbi:Gfo/Idh/MocA family oxidoreductase [Aquibacillus koreensis]|uniref:Gfo/Idh/MocA family oxidoreductase n=1 Tax=Aquibacillus koreensis TaxID=279446 RepID=A0A9X4AJX9_9BACI|nr:Gfo/Idh/MocA family oxidoreductase [Aquibacillus koreensis]MCT2535454.1 Gfo/Idh/MocA family oxidoreductase [Aquibacillus koreensis]MDC3422289.1 Gfo/Idh/MocA family oxidoreductase [Aquibacillus koreensis]